MDYYLFFPGFFLHAPFFFLPCAHFLALPAMSVHLRQYIKCHFLSTNLFFKFLKFRTVSFFLSDHVPHNSFLGFFWKIPDNQSVSCRRFEFICLRCPQSPAKDFLLCFCELHFLGCFRHFFVFLFTPNLHLERKVRITFPFCLPIGIIKLFYL